MKKILFSVIGISFFLSSCNSKSLSLPEYIMYISASYFSGFTKPEDKLNYTIKLNLDEKDGRFSLLSENINYLVNIILTDENILKIKAELNKVRYKDCKAEENNLPDAPSKVINFSNVEAIPVPSQASLNLNSLEIEQTRFFIYTNKNCVIKENSYYFTSSYKSLYDLFIEIIEAQSGADELPEGWQDKI